MTSHERETETRVAAVLDTAQVSGPGRQLAELASRLPAARVQLRVFTFSRAGKPRSPYLDYLDRAAVAYSVIPDGGPFDVRLIPRLRRELAKWNPHIVQTHGYKPAALAFALRSAGARWSWIAFSHGATAENRKVILYHWIEQRLIRRADRVVVMSTAQQEQLSRLDAKVRVLHNAAIPLPPEEPSVRAAFQSMWATDVPRIAVIGRLSPEKGVDVFLRACRILVQERVDFVAIIAGDGPARRHLEQLHSDLALGHRVRFVGVVSAVRAMYARLDLLVIPSRSEGLPNVLLEALRCDVPVVATRVGAIPEVLDSSDAGVLVPAGDAAALAQAIAHGLRLKTDPLSRDARRAVTDRFSPERRVNAHMELYDEVLRQEVVR